MLLGDIIDNEFYQHFQEMQVKWWKLERSWIYIYFEDKLQVNHKERALAVEGWNVLYILS